MSLSSHAYSGAKDLQSMIDLLIAVRPSDRISDYPSVADLREALALTRVRENKRLWFDARDQIVGFAFVDSYSNLRFDFSRQGLESDIEKEIVTWGVECVQRAMQEKGEPLTLDASCRADDVDRIALLERHGFVMQDLRSLQLVRSLSEPIPAPQVPAGFSVRNVTGEHEVEALVALHTAAFGTKNMTVKERLAMMCVSGYDSELDFLAVAPDDSLAAYCVCSISQEGNEITGRSEGHADTIATHPDFRQRGLARALLLTGLGRLKQYGLELALLGTSSENIAMQRTARAVSFRVLSTKLWFAKPVSQNQSAG